MIQKKTFLPTYDRSKFVVIDVPLQALCFSCCSASSFHPAVCHILTFCILSFF